MLKSFALIATVCALATPAAFAHNEARSSAKPDAAAPPAQAPTAGTRDPRAYFTDADLLTQDGRKIKFYSDMLHDRVVVANVMYANCKDACPLITKQMVDVKDELGELFGKKVYFVSITSDPVRDTPRAMKRYAQEQHADVAGWTFLTGSKNNVDGVLQRLGALSENFEEHATLLYILDVDNKRMRKMLPNLPPKAIAEAARLIATADKRPAAATVPKPD